MSHILLWSGSNRRHSWNSRWLDHLSLMLPKSITVERIQTHDLDWPMFNQDHEDRPDLQSAVLRTHQRLAQADAWIVASPEFNGMVTPFLKNSVDWLSRLAYIRPDIPNVFLDKPILLCAASTGGSGGVMGLTHARALFSYVGACVFGQTLTLPFAHLHDTGSGMALDPDQQGVAQNALERFIAQTPSHD